MPGWCLQEGALAHWSDDSDGTGGVSAVITCQQCCVLMLSNWSHVPLSLTMCLLGSARCWLCAHRAIRMGARHTHCSRPYAVMWSVYGAPVRCTVLGRCTGVEAPTLLNSASRLHAPEENDCQDSSAPSRPSCSFGAKLRRSTVRGLPGALAGATSARLLRGTSTARPSPCCIRSIGSICTGGPFLQCL